MIPIPAGRRGATRPPGHRFPIRQDLRCVARKRSGIPEVGPGTTIYISRREIGFTTDLPLALGQKVELTVNWPVLLDRTCRMKLVVSGHVVMNDGGTAAVRIERYEFRTRAAGPLTASVRGAARVRRSP